VSGESIDRSLKYTLFFLLVEHAVTKDARQLLPSLRTSPLVFVTIRKRQYQKQPYKKHSRPKEVSSSDRRCCFARLLRTG
jgi:hypothetical protein